MTPCELREPRRRAVFLRRDRPGRSRPRRGVTSAAARPAASGSKNCTRFAARWRRGRVVDAPPAGDWSGFMRRLDASPCRTFDSAPATGERFVNAPRSRAARPPRTDRTADRPCRHARAGDDRRARGDARSSRPPKIRRRSPCRRSRRTSPASRSRPVTALVRSPQADQSLRRGQRGTSRTVEAGRARPGHARSRGRASRGLAVRARRWPARS